MNTGGITKPLDNVVTGSFTLKRIFKYPSSKYPGQLNDGGNEFQYPANAIQVIGLWGNQDSVDATNWICSLVGFNKDQPYKSFVMHSTDIKNGLTITAKRTPENIARINPILKGLANQLFFKWLPSSTWNEDVPQDQKTDIVITVGEPKPPLSVPSKSASPP
jgi:hypothetical protein